MKINQLFIQRAGLIAAAFGFVSITLSPLPASAQTITVGNNKADCIAKQSAITDVNKLKEYGNQRIAAREKSLAKFDDKKLETIYSKLDAQFTKSKKSAEKIAKKELAIQKPANHKQAVTEDRNSISTALTGKKETLKTANDSAHVANLNCDVIWDLRIASYIAPKLNAQVALDTYSTANSVNKALYEVALANNKANGIKNPVEIDNRIGVLQGQLNLITISQASTDFKTKVSPLSSKASNIFDPLKTESKAISTDLKAASKALPKVVNAINKDQKATSPNGGVISGTTSPVATGVGAAAPKKPTKKELSDKAKANRAAAPGACKDIKGANKVASTKEAKAACEYGFKTTGPQATRKKACDNKFKSIKKAEKKDLLANMCNNGIARRS